MDTTTTITTVRIDVFDNQYTRIHNTWQMEKICIAPMIQVNNKVQIRWKDFRRIKKELQESLN